ncbi:hypothetical protein V8C44DRAFT_316258 [Trichoderma aethiopicum]
MPSRWPLFLCYSEVSLYPSLLGHCLDDPVDALCLTLRLTPERLILHASQRSALYLSGQELVRANGRAVSISSFRLNPNTRVGTIQGLLSAIHGVSYCYLGI